MLSRTLVAEILTFAGEAKYASPCMPDTSIGVSETQPPPRPLSSTAATVIVVAANLKVSRHAKILGRPWT